MLLSRYNWSPIDSFIVYFIHVNMCSVWADPKIWMLNWANLAPLYITLYNFPFSQPLVTRRHLRVGGQKPITFPINRLALSGFLSVMGVQSHYRVALHINWDECCCVSACDAMLHADPSRICFMDIAFGCNLTNASWQEPAVVGYIRIIRRR